MNNWVILYKPKLIDKQETIRHSGGSRLRSEAFQRNPEGKGTNLYTGLRRYDVKRFFQMNRHFK
jgi:hypothetical protein